MYILLRGNSQQGYVLISTVEPRVSDILQKEYRMSVDEVRSLMQRGVTVQGAYLSAPPEEWVCYDSYQKYIDTASMQYALFTAVLLGDFHRGTLCVSFLNGHKDFRENKVLNDLNFYDLQTPYPLENGVLDVPCFTVVLPALKQMYTGVDNFDVENIQSVTIPETMIGLSDAAFKECTRLCRVDLPDSVRVLGDECFMQAISLKEVKLPKYLDLLPYRCFYNCFKLGTITMPSAMRNIETECFARTGLHGIILNDGLQSIGESAFALTKLNEIALPDTVTHVGKSCFKGCKDLRAVRLPMGIKVLSEGMFEDCVNLESIEIPESVEVIQERCFMGCTALREVKGLSHVRDVRYRAFAGCNNLQGLALNTAVVDKYKIWSIDAKSRWLGTTSEVATVH